MNAAIEQAQKAARIGEVPVGAVIVKGNDIISAAYNQRETQKSAMYHAEVNAINSACSALSGWRLWQCELYVTLEPCPMCAGAIINARIPRVVFGAYDPKAGSCGSVVDLFSLPYNHKPEVVGGVLEEECAAMLRDFFRSLRYKKAQLNI